MKEKRYPISLDLKEWDELNQYIPNLGEKTQKVQFGSYYVEYIVKLTEEEMELAQYFGTRGSKLWNIIQQAGKNRLRW